jgi:hypothetical protein
VLRKKKGGGVLLHRYWSDKHRLDTERENVRKRARAKRESARERETQQERQRERERVRETLSSLIYLRARSLERAPDKHRCPDVHVLGCLWGGYREMQIQMSMGLI